MPLLEKPSIPTPSPYSLMPTTMAAPKPLHELLSNAQEPFLLQDYILDRRSQLNRPPVPALSKPKLQDFHFPDHYDFCLKRISFVGSHNPKKSSLFEFPSTGAPPRSQCLKNAVSLRVPARTSRIQRSGSARLPRKRSLGSGFVGLILKRFVRWKSETARFGRNGDDDEPSHIDTASGGGDYGQDNDVEGNGAVCDESSCGSLLPFETRGSSIADGRSPEFSSPPASPKHFGEGNEEEANCRPIGKNVDEEQAEREQFSPVSVLDPTFKDVDSQAVDHEEDDEDLDSQVGDHDEDDEDVEDVGFNYDCSYAFVQRTKEQLLDKLNRFERLARLDPVELEKRMLDSDVEQNVSFEDTTAIEHEDHVTICFHGPGKSPNGISKLIAEVEGEFKSSNLEDRLSVIGSENKRLESCTDDAIADKELRARWKPDEEQFEMLAKEIEVCMFQSLLEEITVEDTSIC